MSDSTSSGNPGAVGTVTTNPADQAAANVTGRKFGEQAQATGQTPTGADAGNPTTAAAQEAMKKFKVKVDNQEMEVDEDELKKGYAHSKAAAKRFQEGQKMKQQSEAFIKMLKDEGQLFSVLEKLGHNPRNLAEKYLAEQIKTELMDPKDRELMTYKQKVEAFEKSELDRKEGVKRQEHDKLKAKMAQEFTQTFVDALKESGLPPTKPMVAEMAKYIKRAADIGYKLSPQDAAKLVKEDETARFHGVVGETEAEILANMLGEKNLQKLREYEAQRLKNPNAHLKTPVEQADERLRKEKDQRMTPLEWRRHKMGL